MPANSLTSKTRKTRILIIYTGGTVGMIQNEKGALVPFNFRQIQTHIPELKKFGYELEVTSFDVLIDSSNMNPSHWIKMVEIIEKNYSSFDGFVILHGTDTMAYTASALSFMIENLSKPIILTGSQLPIGEIRTDAKENIITALEIAAAKYNHYPLVPEVCIYFNYHLYRGNRAKKVESTHFDAFYSENYPVLAEAGVEIEFNTKLLLPVPRKKTVFNKNINQNIALIKLYPGISIDMLSAIFNKEGLKGVVLETYGAGNAPSDKEFTNLLTKAIKKGIHILNVSQCVGGSVILGLYETSSILAKIGVINMKDSTTEAAVTKLMVSLGKNKDNKTTRKLLSESLAGELS